MKKNKLPGLVVILILTLLTGTLWVSLNIYRAFTVKPAESVPEAIFNPIVPTLDQGTIQKIESGIFLDESQIPQNVISATSSPIPNQIAQTPSPTIIPKPTQSASSSATPTVP